jgi:hypothetical protein
MCFLHCHISPRNEFTGRDAIWIDGKDVVVIIVSYREGVSMSTLKTAWKTPDISMDSDMIGAFNGLAR